MQNDPVWVFYHPAVTPWSRPRIGRGGGRRTAVVATAIVLTLVGTACGSTPAESTSATATAAASAGSTSTAPGSASGLKTIDQAALQAIVDETAQELLVPGCLVLLRTPQGEFTAASGTTKLGENSLPTADTHFRIASMTKTMTSAVILLLAQEGKLRLDDPVSKYVPEVPNGDNITIAQAAGDAQRPVQLHRRPRDLDQHGQRPDQGVDAAGAAGHRLRPAARISRPAREYEYSNTNYVLLGLIIEQLDGKPLATAFEDRLFEPLGMTNTVLPSADVEHHPRAVLARLPVRQLLHDDVRAVRRTPRRWRPRPGPGRSSRRTTPTSTTPSPSRPGAVTSTAADLATWMKALAGGKVLNAEYQRLWQDSAQIINPANTYNWYGYGIDQLRWGSQRHRPARRPDPRLQLGSRSTTPPTT